MTSIIAFFVLICVLVFVHEYGHFWAARKCGVKVTRFSIGFGKVLFKKTDKHGTEFAFSLIPLGGYVQMWNGEKEVNATPEQSLAAKSILQRAFIIFAGPAANFIFAILTYWAVFVSGIPTIKPVIGEVLPNTIAAQAKLPVELEITKINNQNIQDWESASLALVGSVGNKKVPLEGRFYDSQAIQHYELDLSNWKIESTKENPLTVLGIRPKSTKIMAEIKEVIENSPAEKAGLASGNRILKVNQQPFDWTTLIESVQNGDLIELQIEQNRQIKTLIIQPEKRDNRYIIGIVPTYERLADKYRTELKYDIMTAFSKSIEKVWSLIQTILQFIGNLISGDLSIKNLGGPISMAKGAGATAEIGWIYYLSFMALISVNLGVMNLFPILPLDGGQLILLAVEAIRGKTLSEKVQMLFQQIGIIFVLGLMFFAFINDILHF